MHVIKKIAENETCHYLNSLVCMVLGATDVDVGCWDSQLGHSAQLFRCCTMHDRQSAQEVVVCAIVLACRTCVCV